MINETRRLPSPLSAAAPHRPDRKSRDKQTAALFVGSDEFLGNLGIWDGLKNDCAPLTATG
jgi:hypothetical protein